MATLLPPRLTKATSTNQSASNESQSTTDATPVTSAIPSTAAHILPEPSGAMPPPPNPNSPASPSTSAQTFSLREAISTSISTDFNTPLSPSGHTTDTTRPAPAPATSPSPHTLKLYSQISTLQSQISTTQTTLADTLTKLQSHLPSESQSGSQPDEPALQAQAEAIVKRHIGLLHAYNEIKDVGQGLIGLIADSRGVRVREVMEEMGVGEKD
jgi:DNA repair protein Swi5/Sae3